MRIIIAAFVWLTLLSHLTNLAAGQKTDQRELTISQYGITWTFTKSASVGRFITGDWWVVGPVTVESVSPTPTSIAHGSVVNPAAGDKQGYDARMHHFDRSVRATFPLSLNPGESLVSTASVDKIGDRTKDTVPGQYCRGPLRTAIVLTCVDKPPPSDAFRPAYVGTWKAMFTASQLNRNRLPALTPAGKVPEIKPYERYLERIWLDHQRGWVSSMMHPLENMPDYGREITNIVSQAGLLVLLEDPDQKRETLLLRYIQKGIDYYGVVQSDDNLWIADGGHNSGRKWPILFAGAMLGNEGMSNVKATFQEDQQTYYGRGSRGQKVLWTIGLNNANARHEEVGADTWDTFGDQRGNNGTKAEAYRKLNGPTWVGEALAVRLLGMTENWNHPAFFDYVDRWRDEEKHDNDFVNSMWQRYRQQADSIGAKMPEKK
jgi:hypothetical protein